VRRMSYRKVLRRYAMSVLVVAIAVMVVLVLSSTSSSLAAQSSGKPEPRYLIPGLLAPALKHHSPLHATQHTTQLDLSIALNMRNLGKLDSLIAAQNNRNSPLYHQYLTPQEFISRFAPDQTSVDAVVSYLRSQNLRIRSVSSNRLLIHASGSVTNVERAFKVTLADYVVGGHTVYAPTSEPSVPAGLAGMVLNISGLDNVTHYHRLESRLVPQKNHPHQGPDGGYTPDEIRTAYDMKPLLSRGADGSGQTVALLELDGYNPADINTYLNHYGLGTPKYSNVLLDGATNNPGSGAIEVELDMEQVSAFAPRAAQKVYIGVNDTAGVNDLYNAIVSDDIAKVVSVSWGLCEPTIGDAELDTLDNFFKQGAAQGQAFFAASGDLGTYDCGDSTLSVDSPADDPNVVGVGGTTLQTGSDGSYLSESAWSCASCTQNGQEGIGGGGGLSAHFARPAYQQGANLTNAHREEPDVSANADPKTGYFVYCTVADAGCPATGWVTVGGSSAAAPLWAGIAADINQYLIAAGKPTLGTANVALYQLYNTPQTYSPYHDVTTGNNLYYPATRGYDLATGIGTPDVWNITRDLQASTGGSGGNNGSAQLLNNAGFENGLSPWQVSSSGRHQIIDASNTHTGSHSAYLCGYNNCTDAIWQSMTLPAKTTKAVLSYWLYIGSQQIGSACHDYFSARVLASNGSIIKTVQIRCNANAGGWALYTFDLSSILSRYSGQQIQVSFKGTTDAMLTTSICVDDVALNVTHS
jgi:subtilase family serine protease